MSLLATRTVLRQSSRAIGRTAGRFESTTTKATEAAKDTASKASQTASEYKSKASEGLSRVTSSAGPAISGAAQSVGNALGRIGGPAGRLIAFVESAYLSAQRPKRLHSSRSHLLMANVQDKSPQLSTTLGWDSNFQSLSSKDRR